MLTDEQNQTLTQVGPGTPMGDLLRRYWHPVAAIAELDEAPIKRVRLLGEELVLYKDGGGTYGLIEQWCAHRGGNIAYGIVEDYGVRCPLHGWLYNEDGLCLDQPLEPEPLPIEVRLHAYEVAEKAGMLWAYLGPAPAPLVPDWEPFAWEDGLVQVVFAVLPCNWFQCHENSLDPMDLEWIHATLTKAAQAKPPPPPPHELDIGFDEFDYGFIYRRAAPGQAAAKDWDVGRVSIWPNGVFTGNRRSCRIEWRVPMTDTATLSVAWFSDRAAPGAALPEKRFYHWQAPVRDEETGETIDSHILNQNFVIWLNQDPIVDRTKENLYAGDRGVVMMRDKFFAQMALIRDGGEPKAVLRDARENQRLRLPLSGQRIADGELGDAPPPDPDALPEGGRFPYLAGQPPDAAEAYRRVIAGWRRGPARRRTKRS